jgi:sugar phosphate isomerase/epimerase
VAPLGRDDLVLCAGTMMRSTLAERIEAAVAGGFAGISLYPSDISRAKAEGMDLATIRRRIEDAGLEIGELDPLMSWLPGSSLGSDATEEGATFFASGERDFYEIAEAIGGRSINAVVMTDDPPASDRIAEAYAALCDRAAEHGLLVHLEYLPWTSIATLDDALQIARQADRPNGGVLVDSWHHFRSGSANPDASARGRILGVQLNDAPRVPPENVSVIDETLHHRRVPGEGDIDLTGLVRALDAAGCSAPIGVEVFSDALAGLAPVEIGQRLGDATRAVLAAARGGA